MVQHPRRPKRALFVIGALCLVLLPGLAFWQWSRFIRTRLATPPGKIVAVVSIDNLTQDASLDSLSRGAAELLTINLSQAKGLEVISTDRVRDLVMRRGKGSAAGEVARDARANLFVTGALVKKGPGLRFEIQVQETATGKVLMEQKAEGADAQAIFAMADRAARGILAELAPGGASSSRPALGVEALRACEEYRFARSQFAADPGAARKAIARAADLASRQPMPRLYTLSLQASQLMFDRKDPEAEAVLESARREFPREIDARLQLASVLWSQWKGLEAKKVLEEILRLDEREAEAWRLLAGIIAMQGDAKKALSAVDRYAALLPPGDWKAIDARGAVLAMNGRYAEAREVYKLGTEPFRVALRVAIAAIWERNYALAEESLKPYAGRPEAQCALGDREIARGQFDRAVKHFDAAGGWCLLKAEALALVRRSPAPEDFQRFLSAAYTSDHQRVIESFPKLPRRLANLYSLHVGRALLASGNLQEAERRLRFTLQAQRNWFNPELIAQSSILTFTLAHFEMGRTLERAGLKAEAIRNYGEFLKYFEGSGAKLPQLDEARAAMTRLRR
ncbi:MAG: hypothetical protein ACRD8O_06155 [Bryobacteraceae bacterium]